VMLEAGDEEGPVAAAVRPLSEAAWECHVAAKVAAALGPAGAPLVMSPARVVPLGGAAGALVMYAREEPATLEDALSAHLGKGKLVGEALALRYAAQVLRLLAALHRSGVVHGALTARSFALRVPAGGAAPEPPGLALWGLGRACDASVLPRGSLLTGRPTDADYWCAEMRAGEAWAHGADSHACAVVLHLLALGRPLQSSPEGYLLPDEAPAALAAWADWRHALGSLFRLSQRHEACADEVEALAAALDSQAATPRISAGLADAVMRQNVLLHEQG